MAQTKTQTELEYELALQNFANACSNLFDVLDRMVANQIKLADGVDKVAEQIRREIENGQNK